MAIPDTRLDQRIARLTPLGDVLAAIEARVAAVAPQPCAVAAALGRTLADDAVASDRPATAIALRDGWAVQAEVTADAGPYAPLPIASPARVDVGDPLPPGCDAVAPLDAVAVRGRCAEAIAAVAPGDGVLAAGADATASAPLRRSGERLRAVDLAVLAAAGLDLVNVREPRIRIAWAGPTRTPLIAAAVAALARAVEAAGGKAIWAAEGERNLDHALSDDNVDAVMAVGGTGTGRHDGAVRTLARHGRVEAHGIALSPGESAAFGFVGARPVLLTPGRLDAVLGVWLLVGRHLLARLAGTRPQDAPAMLTLARKATSTIGLTELVPVRRSGDAVEPLAVQYLPLASLRWRMPTASSWFRPRAKDIPPAR
jgi:molybdopterin biosynthesis enzyme